MQTQTSYLNISTPLQSSKRSATRNLLLMLLPVIALSFSSCNTTRYLKKPRLTKRVVYRELGLQRDLDDNYKLYKDVASWLHTPYVLGGTSHRGIDCSYFVYLIYKKVYHKTVEHNAEELFKKNCRKIRNKRHLREGDLVFFHTIKHSREKINHVGIYLKDHKFVHASTSSGVMVSDLREPYFAKAWVCGGRVRR